MIFLFYFQFRPMSKAFAQSMVAIFFFGMYVYIKPPTPILNFTTTLAFYAYDGNPYSV